MGAIFKKSLFGRQNLRTKGYIWYYDLLILLGTFVIFAENGAEFTIL